MRPLQEIQINILKEFLHICEELNLTYFLVCGSALGAAKYNGFIPWDDDIDVALPREDYEMFCKQAPILLPQHLFLQNSKTDKYFPLMFSKIRDSRTTYIEKSMSSINMNHGVYIDVFPLDGYPVNQRQQKIIEKKKKRYAICTLSSLTVDMSWKLNCLVGLEKIAGIHKKPLKYINRLEKYITRYDTATSEIWCNHGNWQGKLEYAPKWQYGDGMWAMFEGLEVRIPKNYDDYLTQKYGDWKADLPQEQQIGHHYYSICDLDSPYHKYVKIVSDSKIRIIL